MTFQRKLLLKTKNNGEWNDLTESVRNLVSESGIQCGMVNVFNVGNSAAIGTIEFESGLRADFCRLIERLIPNQGENDTEHALPNGNGPNGNGQDGNGRSQLQASLLGQDITIPVQQGQMVLGSWQQIFHLECDTKPRIREIMVTVCGD
ncbi:MAG: secondary thiamine-phosphate synthase enzyme YjbQ [Planctomycetota bacterium]|nr:secondary thiamine-phosphate synthase enzyme YjbQ [Planctomycetota bacterium]